MDLRLEIESRKLRQKAIAARLGVSASTLSRWIRGRTAIPSTYIRPLADCTGLTLDQILPPLPERSDLIADEAQMQLEAI